MSGPQVPYGAHVPYGGVATRALGLAIDGAIAQGIVFSVGAVLALVGSLVAEIQFGTTAKVLAGAAWLLFEASYFVVFWSTAGQTPGMRIMGIRVVEADGGRPGVTRSIVRVAGLALAIIPCFLGFVPVLFDNRRRGLHDMLARTVVIYDADSVPLPEPAPASSPQRTATRPAPPIGMTLEPKEQP